MSDNDFEFKPDDRPVDWRWRLAKFVVAGRLTKSAWRYVDNAVRRAVRALEGAPDPEIETMLELRYHGDILDRAEVSARILAGQALDEIAAAVGLPWAVVGLFEQLMFDARNPRAWYADIPGLDFAQEIDEDDVEAVFNRVGARHRQTEVDFICVYYRCVRCGGQDTDPIHNLTEGPRSTLTTSERLVRALIEPFDMAGWQEAIYREGEANGLLPRDRPVHAERGALMESAPSGQS